MAFSTSKEHRIAKTDLQLDQILKVMNQLLEHYDHYDLTVDILSAWFFYQQRWFNDAYFDCTSTLRDSNGSQDCKPDFTIQFPFSDYALIGEVKASLSVGSDSLEDLRKQVQSRVARRYSFPCSPDGTGLREPEKQDLLVIVPGSRAAAVRTAFAQNPPIPSDGQHVCLCAFGDEDQHGRTLVFTRHPLENGRDRLRDAFLAEENRISRYLDRGGIRIPLRKFEMYRDRIITNSDGVLSNLGLLLKLLGVAEELYGPASGSRLRTDKLVPNAIEFTLPALLSKLRGRGFFCAVSRSEVINVFSLLVASRQSFFSFDSSTLEVTYHVPRRARYGEYRKEQVLQQLPKRRRQGLVPVFAFHLARGILLREQRELDANRRTGRIGQLSLFGP